MVKSFFFVGNADVESALSNNLASAGFAIASEAALADVVFVYCETQSALEDAFFETGGLTQLVSSGTYLVTLSSTTPSFARELYAVALINDLRSVQAPLVVKDVFLPDAYRDAKNLCCLVDGEEEDFKVLSSMLNAIAGVFKFTGDAGSAQTARAALTIQVAAQVMAAIEVSALNKMSAIPSEQITDFMVAEGFSPQNNLSLLKAIAAKNFTGTYTVSMCMAEMAAALMTADDVELILPAAEACMHLLELLAIIGGGNYGLAALSLVYGDEETCAKHGLDWTRVEQDYFSDSDEEEDEPEARSAFGGYSPN